MCKCNQPVTGRFPVVIAENVVAYLVEDTVLLSGFDEMGKPFVVHITDESVDILAKVCTAAIESRKEDISPDAHITGLD